MTIENSENEITPAEQYASNTWFRTALLTGAGALGIAVPSVPVAAAAIDTILTMRGAKAAQRRLDVLCDRWESEMKRLKGRTIDREYVESEAFLDLIVQAWEATKRTRHDEKIALYAKVLAGAVVIQERAEHEPEDYLGVLAELSLREIALARVLYRLQREGPSEGEGEMSWLWRIVDVPASAQRKPTWRYIIAERANIRETNIDYLLLRLESSGLIKEVVGTIVGYNGGIYTITDALKSLVDFLPLQEL